MSTNKYGINVTRPISALNRSIKFSYKDFFKSISKAILKGVGGNYQQALGDVVDALSSVQLRQEIGEVAWLLIQRSLLQAVHDLLKENEALLYRDSDNLMVVLSKNGLPLDDPDAITARLDLSLEESEVIIDENFFRHPRTLSVLEQFKTPFKHWLELFGLNEAEANSIANRLPSYFIQSLNDQWRARADDYRCVKEAFDTPFTKASVADQAWYSYAALLQRQVDEPMFVEAFSLRLVYVPLRAYYFQKGSVDKETRFDVRASEAEKAKRIVVDLSKELETWLDGNEPGDAIRIISGGPGSGKSSFTRMLAAKLAEADGRRVLFVPLHLLELSDDIEEAIQKFIRYIEPALANPLAPDETEPYLIIFDGLDELAMQGKIAAELAQQFVREVREKVARLNYTRGSRIKILISGREIAVQSNASDFKRPGQILYVLPYFVPDISRRSYTDPQQLLQQDQRQQWWANYGKASSYNYDGLPEELNRNELLEITSQPLLNYLIALSFTRGEINLATESNLNVIYSDLLKAVYERGWGEGPNLAVQGVPEDKFVRWLEEIAVAAWHGDGRTTTVEEIKAHTESSGATSLMKLFEEGADKGITRLLMAFYFRRAGVRESGEKTFEFTHKSFGEYLTAKRIVRLLGAMHEELERHQQNIDMGWDERAALVRWIKLCGPTVLDKYVFKFIENEVRLNKPSYVSSWQETLCKLIGFELRNGMPMEAVNLSTFKEASRHARNVEESLIVVLNACANVTKLTSDIDWPDHTSFKSLLYRLGEQRGDLGATLALDHLGFLNLGGQHLALLEFYRANIDDIDLYSADFRKADLRQGNFSGADLSGANFSEANLSGADLSGANLCGAGLSGASFDGADLSGTDLYAAILTDVDLNRADLSRAYLESANLSDVNLRGAILRGADLGGADLSGADLGEANLSNSDLRGADLTDADLKEANLSGADFTNAELGAANLGEADFENVDSSGVDFKDVDFGSLLFDNRAVERDD
jgi:uncharacterized protein YjbI with pentapeptide repeats